jgi:hypothetical protein
MRFPLLLRKNRSGYQQDVERHKGHQTEADETYPQRPEDVPDLEAGRFIQLDGLVDGQNTHVTPRRFLRDHP